MIVDFNKMITTKVGSKKMQDLFETMDRINAIAEERIKSLKDK